MARGTTYGSIDSLAGLSMAAIDGLDRPSMATKFGLAGPVIGGLSVT